MTIPASLTVVTLTGTFLDSQGAPRTGKVLFRTPGYTMSGADDTFVVPRLTAAFLDGSGSFSIALPATNDPDWTPVGWTYSVTLDFGDDGKTFFGNIVVPYNLGSTLSLASLAPVPEANGQLYALYNDPRFSGTGGGGGGGAVDSVFGRTGAVTAQTGDYTKAQVGLGNVDNTSDVSKPVSTATATALAGKSATGHSHVEGDVTNLVSDLSALSTAVSGKSAIGHSHVEGDVTNLITDLAGKAGAVHTHTESDVTSLVADLALKAPLASPTFTGTPAGPTATPGTNTTQLATTAFAAALGATLQPLDSDLTTIAGLTATTNNIIQSVAGAWASRTPTQVKTALAIATGDVSGLGGAATLNVGTTTGTVAAGDDSRITGALQKSVATTKGDLFVATGSGTIVRLGVGADTQVLIADSAQAAGVKWGAGGGGGGTYSLPEGLDPPSNFWQPMTPGRTSINLTPAVGKTYYMPLPMGNTTRTLLKVGIEVRTAAGAGGLASMSLVSTSGRLPTTEIANYGTVATDTTGLKTWSPNTSQAANTLYWVAVNFTVAAPAVVAIDAFNPYVAANANFSGTTAFGSYIMNGNLTGSSTFVYFDVDACIRVVVQFS